MVAPACRRCGHERDSHPPCIPGASKPGYCASCGCCQHKPERPWTRLLAWFRLEPAPVRVDVLWQRPVRYPVPGWTEDDDDWTQFGIRVAPYVPRPRGEAR